MHSQPFRLQIALSLLAIQFLQGKEGIIFPSDQFESSSPWEWDFGGQVEATYFSTGNPPAALLERGGQTVDPRLIFTLDARYQENLHFHTTARLDRGFDPASNGDFELRVDELFLRHSSWDGVLDLQVGKFATVFGGWVKQHEYTDDPFITPPLPYSQILGISVNNPNTLSPAAISQAAQAPTSRIFTTPKSTWASTIWGPSYGSGLSVSGQRNGFEYAAEIKNLGLSRRSSQWDEGLDGFENPTFSGRVGYRPSAALSYGFSASRGPYLDPESEALLPSGVDIGDLPYTTLGADISWAHRDLIISGEIIASRFETLAAGDLDSLSYYAQVRWKFAPGLWVAGRWGQTFNNDARGLNGESVEWSPDLWRISASVGWRATPELLFKTEYNYTFINDSRVEAQQLFGLGVNYQF